MDERAKIVLAFLIGGSIGAFIGHKIATKNMKEEFVEYYEEVEKDFEELKERTQPYAQAPNRPDRPVGVYNRPTRKPINYSKASEVETSSIQVITEEEFLKGMPLFEKISLSLYNDGILVDESSAIAEMDMEGVLGIDNLNFEPGQMEAIYIRNLRLKVDYEINKVWENYFPEKEPASKLTEELGEIVDFDADGKKKRKRRS
jgi:hypothetical protein